MCGQLSRRLDDRSRECPSVDSAPRRAEETADALLPILSGEAPEVFSPSSRADDDGAVEADFHAVSEPRGAQEGSSSPPLVSQAIDGGPVFLLEGWREFRLINSVGGGSVCNIAASRSTGMFVCPSTRVADDRRGSGISPDKSQPC